MGSNEPMRNECEVIYEMVYVGAKRFLQDRRNIPLDRILAEILSRALI